MRTRNLMISENYGSSKLRILLKNKYTLSDIYH